MKIEMESCSFFMKYNNDFFHQLKSKGNIILFGIDIFLRKFAL